MRNHQSRPTGSKPFPEVNAISFQTRGRRRGRGRGRGHGRNHDFLCYLHYALFFLLYLKFMCYLVSR